MCELCLNSNEFCSSLCWSVTAMSVTVLNFELHFISAIEPDCVRHGSDSDCAYQMVSKSSSCSCGLLLWITGCLIER